jgi:hypothetical protein
VGIGEFPLGVKRPGRETDYSPPTIADLYIHVHIRLHGPVLNCLNFKCNFTRGRSCLCLRWQWCKLLALHCREHRRSAGLLPDLDPCDPGSIPHHARLIVVDRMTLRSCLLGPTTSVSPANSHPIKRSILICVYIHFLNYSEQFNNCVSET